MIPALNYFAYATKENTCPKCKGALMTPYFLNGFNNKGIIQCTKCDYNREVSVISTKSQENKNNA